MVGGEETLISVFLSDDVGPVSLVLDVSPTSVRGVALTLFLMTFCIERDPRPDDIDGPLNQDSFDMIRDYGVDYNNRPSNSISFIPAVPRTSGGLHCELV